MSLPAEQTEEQLPPLSELPPSDGRHDPYAAFQSKPYAQFAASFALAALANQAIATTVAWQFTKHLTNEGDKALALGGIGLIQAIPILLLALPAGHVADSYPRRTIMWITQLMLLGSAVLLGLMLLTNNFHIGLAYGLLLVNAISFTFQRPARASMMPTLVPAKDISNAVTWNATIFETCSVAGPTVAGPLIQYFSPAVAMFVSAAMAAAGLVLILQLPRAPAAAAKERPNFASLMAGLRFVFRTRLLLAVMSLDLFAVLLGGAVYLLPIFAERLHLGAVGFSWLMAAPSIGAIGMALVIAHLPPMKRAGPAMLVAVAIFGVATIVFGLSTSFWLSFAMLVVCGVADNISVVVRHSLVQMLTPDAMRGRVGAANQIFIGSSNELGGLESGLTARWMGPVASVVTGGIGVLVVVAIVALRFPEVWRLRKLTDVAPADAEPPPAGGFGVAVKPIETPSA
jgi:MFS family permease